MNLLKPFKKEIITKEGKRKTWVFVKCPGCDYERPVSFEELGEMLRMIGECEDKIYLENGGKGADMVIDFSKDAVLGIPYEELKKKYKLPK
jgi:hypothetical protein